MKLEKSEIEFWNELKLGAINVHGLFYIFQADQSFIQANKRKQYWVSTEWDLYLSNEGVISDTAGWFMTIADAYAAINKFYQSDTFELQGAL